MAQDYFYIGVVILICSCVCLFFGGMIFAFLNKMCECFGKIVECCIPTSTVQNAVEDEKDLNFYRELTPESLEKIYTESKLARDNFVADQNEKFYHFDSLSKDRYEEEATVSAANYNQYLEKRIKVIEQVIDEHVVEFFQNGDRILELMDTDPKQLGIKPTSAAPLNHKIRLRFLTTIQPELTYPDIRDRVRIIDLVQSYNITDSKNYLRCESVKNSIEEFKARPTINGKEQVYRLDAVENIDQE